MNGAEGHRSNSIIRELRYIVNIPVLPVISQWDSSFKMENSHNFFRFFFCVCGLTDVLLVGGLGVED